MGFFPFFSLHPALMINVLIAVLIGIALIITSNPLVLLGLAFMLFHSSQQIMTQGDDGGGSGEMVNEAMKEEYGEPSMGFTAQLR